LYFVQFGVFVRFRALSAIQAIKQRFEIIGNEPKLNRAIEKEAIQVAH
jgi:hypothetical protein